MTLRRGRFTRLRGFFFSGPGLALMTGQAPQQVLC